MQTRSDAEEHLRIIRSLMEKATIYRAISAEAAAVGGGLAIVASFAFGNYFTPVWEHRPPGSVEPLKFVALWIGVLTIAGLSNAIFLYRGAVSRGEVFISSGMRLAAKALAPSFLLAGACTLHLLWRPWLSNLDIRLTPMSFESIVPIWIICYGLALLATSHFAPRSLWWLGWAFFIAGLVAAATVPFARHLLMSWVGMPSQDGWRHVQDWTALNLAQRWMAGTFGVFHLIYAACTWPRRARGADAAARP